MPGVREVLKGEALWCWLMKHLNSTISHYSVFLTQVIFDSKCGWQLCLGDDAVLNCVFKDTLVGDRGDRTL